MDEIYCYLKIRFLNREFNQTLCLLLELNLENWFKLKLLIYLYTNFLKVYGPQKSPI